MVCKWWEQWGWPAIPEICLPTTGIVIQGERSLCAGWLYRTDSAVCWAENYVSDKTVSKAERTGSVEMLINSLIEEGHRLGFKVLMSSVRNPSLINKLIKSGFDVNYDKDMSNLTRVL